MIRRTIHHRRATKAPERSGAVLCALIAIFLVACDRKGGTPDWDRPGEAPPAPVESAAPASPTADAPADAPAKQRAGGETRKPSAAGLRVMAYNVENWLTMDRYVDNKPLKQAPKPEKDREAAIRLVARHTPDVLGLCEIGSAGDLAEIQEALARKGWDMPHSHFTGGSDEVRHLGLLSRFPITETGKPAETEFKLQGRTYAINRGILDATVQARGKGYRFLGVHLKSKREVPEFDQEQMRVSEARLLRRHVDSILAADPEARLVVYGDFNDTRPTATIKTVTGAYDSPGYLTAVPFKDSRGHSWTHYWRPHDIYSRIDFLMVSRPLRSELDFKASYIVDDPEWLDASDHRAVLAIFR